MKIQNRLFLIFLFITLIGCSVTKKQKKGIVLPESFNFETKFTTVKTLILLPFEVNGELKNFLFDTGADLSLIQRDSLIGKTYKVTGASKDKAKFGYGIVKSLKLGQVNFTNTMALNGDLKGLKEQILNFGGIIGQPIISKANWLIDYPNEKIRLSNKNLIDTTFKAIHIKREDGAPYTYISINGEKYKVIVDLGSSSELNVPKESKLARLLLEQYNFEDNERDRYTIGGSQIIKEKVGVLPSVKLGDIEFKNIRTTINTSSQPRIGIAFFKDCIVYIDNIEGNYKVKK